MTSGNEKEDGYCMLCHDFTRLASPPPPSQMDRATALLAMLGFTRRGMWELALRVADLEEKLDSNRHEREMQTIGLASKLLGGRRNPKPPSSEATVEEIRRSTLLVMELLNSEDTTPEHYAQWSGFFCQMTLELCDRLDRAAKS